MSTKQDTETPRVWIGSLAAYNDGRLVGEWTDADDLETLEEVAARVLKAGGGEEIALMDREGFGSLIDEYTALNTVAAIAEALVEHGEPFRLYVENQGYSLGPEDVGPCVGDFEESYQGYWGGFNPMRDYAEAFADDIGAVPDDLQWPMNHIDWDAAARELSMDYWEQDGHIFRSV